MWEPVTSSRACLTNDVIRQRGGPCCVALPSRGSPGLLGGGSEDRAGVGVHHDSMIHDIRWWQSRGGRERGAGRLCWSGTGAGWGAEEEEDASPMEWCPQLVAAEPVLVPATC